MKINKRAHSVKRFSVEIDYSEEKIARETQDKVISIVRNKLVKILEEACSNNDQDNLIRIRNLTFDLGDISVSDIDTHLPRLFEKKVNEIFSGFRNNIVSDKGLEGLEIIDQEKQILLFYTYYLKYGTIPWYINNAFSDYTFADVFAYLIEKNHDSFIQEFFNLLEYSNVRRRLVPYIDSGEIIQIFKRNLQEVFVFNIEVLYKEINQLIHKSNTVESSYKTYLLLYVKEFFLLVSLDAKKNNQIFTIELLTTKFIEFVFEEKSISPIKWLPSLIAEYVEKNQKNTSVGIIISSMQEYYTNYLFDEKIEISSSKKSKLTDKTQFYNWLVEMQPLAGRYLSKAIESIIKLVSKHFTSVEKTKLEQIILEIAQDIIPEISIAQENVTKWVYAITKQATEVFGIPLKQIVTDLEIEVKTDKAQSKETTDKSKETTDQLKVTTDQLKEITDQSQDTTDQIQKTIDKKQKYIEFDTSITRDYLSLFIKSGLSPFKKLYQNPPKVLKDLFQKYIDEDKGAKAFIIDQLEDNNVMVFWWIKEAFGDDFLSRFIEVIGKEKQDILPKEIFDDFSSKDIEEIGKEEKQAVFPRKLEFEYLLLVSFIRTGAFPWPELIEKGLDSLVESIMQFASKERKESLREVLIDEGFFVKKSVMEKVFQIMPIEFGKELLKIRKELVSKGILDSLITMPIVELDLDKKEDEFVEKIEEKVGEKEAEAEAEKLATAEEAEKVAAEKVEAAEEAEKVEEIDLRQVDGIVKLIIEFSKRKFFDIVLQKKQANLIFNEILRSTRKSLYETAAALVSIDKKDIDSLMLVFDTNQKDYIKKLVRNYRARFVNIAEELREREKREEENLLLTDGETAEAFYINNAGIVLLNVYMKRLFSRFDLLDKKEFKTDEAREKAIYILHYLASKNDNPEEYEITLNKILVGMPLSAPLKFDIKITDEEKEVCDNMLEAVVKNWSVLKNTSADGLRGSYLLRKGSLRNDEKGWHLKVEKKTYDILLGKLPWGYTMIHFPWMKKPLLTEWED